VKFRTGQAALAPFRRSLASWSEKIGEPDDSFVAFPFLDDEMAAQSIRRNLARNTDLAVYLPAENFDPPEDHPPASEFNWAPILVNDFSDVNDDIGTLAGVLDGHFSRLLQWQPRVDKAKTQLIAIVAPGPWNRTKVLEGNSTPILGQKLVEYGYSAVGIRCKAGSDDEFADALSYAVRLAEASGLTLLHVGREARDIGGTPFSLTVRELRSVAER
jgi:hypothetical protein